MVVPVEIRRVWENPWNCTFRCLWTVWLECWKANSRLVKRIAPFVLIAFLSNWHKLELSGKREPQLMNCLYKINLWECLWQIFLINQWNGRHSPLQATTLLERSPQPECQAGHEKEANLSAAFFGSFWFHFFLNSLELLSYQPSETDCKL